MTSTEIVRVPFHGTDLLTVDVDGKPHIVLRPAIEAIGLSYPAQLVKLRSRSWACLATSATQLPGDSQSRSPRSWLNTPASPTGEDGMTINWRKSSRSWDIKSLKCVEVAATGTGVLVRDSKNQTQTPLCFTRPEWDSFLNRVKHSELPT